MRNALIESKIEIQRDVLESWLKISGFTKSQLAKSLDVSKGRVSQLFRSGEEPSTRLIAGLLALTRLPFERLFALKTRKPLPGRKPSIPSRHKLQLQVAGVNRGDNS